MKKTSAFKTLFFHVLLPILIPAIHAGAVDLTYLSSNPYPFPSKTYTAQDLGLWIDPHNGGSYYAGNPAFISTNGVLYLNACSSGKTFVPGTTTGPDWSSQAQQATDYARQWTSSNGGNTWDQGQASIVIRAGQTSPGQDNLYQGACTNSPIFFNGMYYIFFENYTVPTGMIAIHAAQSTTPQGPYKIWTTGGWESSGTQGTPDPWQPVLWPDGLQNDPTGAKQAFFEQYAGAGVVGNQYWGAGIPWVTLMNGQIYLYYTDTTRYVYGGTSVPNILPANQIPYNMVAVTSDPTQFLESSISEVDQYQPSNGGMAPSWVRSMPRYFSAADLFIDFYIQSPSNGSSLTLLYRVSQDGINFSAPNALSTWPSTLQVNVGSSNLSFLNTVEIDQTVAVEGDQNGQGSFSNLLFATMEDAVITPYTSGTPMTSYSQIHGLRMNPVNQPPIVSAGADQTITLPANATLNGTIVPGTLPIISSTWSVISKPANGSVVFSSTYTASTQATFSQAGIYGVRLAAYDGQYVVTSSMTMTVLLSSPSVLSNFCSADGQTGTIQFSQVTGATAYSIWYWNNTDPADFPGHPGPVVAAPASSISFGTTPGLSYVAVVIAQDSSGNWGAGGWGKWFSCSLANQPPVVSACTPAVIPCPVQTITLPAQATLTGTASDDGLPYGILSTTWSVVSGPGSVIFTSTFTPTTNAQLSTPGAYVFQLTSTDGQYIVSSSVTVNAALPSSGADTISASPDPCVASGGGLCAANIAWHISTVSQAMVRLSVDGAADVEFSCGVDGSGNGSQSAPWIGPGHSYEFRLYNAASDCSSFSGSPLNMATVSAVPNPWSAPRPAVGLNKFDLALQYLGRASGGDGTAPYQAVTQAMARKAIVDAKNTGVTYLRVSIMGYGPVLYNSPGDLDLWVSNPAAYWAIIDQMMSDLNASGVRIIPSFVWNWVQIPSMTGENVAQMMTNPNSKSYQLLTKYISDFVSRYKNNPALDLYELTNELNLGEDLDNVNRCLNNPPSWDPQKLSCLPQSNFSTDQMIAFTSRLAAYIRSLDPAHPISSGFGLPRTNAEHMRAQPEWSPSGPDWTADTQAQFQKNLGDIHQGVDLVSMHFYNGGDNDRFGVTGQMNAGLLDIVKSITDGINKPLFIGEFSDVSPYVYNTATHAEDPTASFTKNVFAKVQSLGIPYSAPWIWEFYQSSLNSLYTSPGDGMILDPSYTPVTNAALAQTNKNLGNPVPPSQSPDTTPPIVVLTWPLGGSAMNSSQLLYAVASDNNGTVSKVEYWVDGALKATVTAAPYQYTLDTTHMVSGSHQIVAKAYDPAGNNAQYSATVTGGSLINQPPVVSACTPAVIPCPAQTVTLPNYAVLQGAATDDGLPYGILSTTWSFVSGPGTVIFTSTYTPVTHANFSAPGTYVLQLKADDGALQAISNVTVAVQGSPNLVLTKSASATTAKTGDAITFTIQYQNTGTGDAVNAVIADPVPAGTTLVSGSISNGGTVSNNTISWNLGTVAAGSNRSVNFQVQVN